MSRLFIAIPHGARVTLANGQPAYTRNLRVTATMIREHGGYAQAREALVRETNLRRFS